MDEALLAYPGFADPVHDAQSSFRAVLQALARPGRIAEAALPLPPPPLAQATAAVLLSLADAAAPVHLAGRFSLLAPWVAFHTGSTQTGVEHADFVLTETLPGFADLRPGSDEIPEASTTVILQVPTLTDGPRLTLSGPGIETTAAFTPQGLPANFPERWAANHRLFPRGIDLILCAGRHIAALPRSTNVTRAE